MSVVELVLKTLQNDSAVAWSKHDPVRPIDLLRAIPPHPLSSNEHRFCERKAPEWGLPRS